ncbi:Diphthamide biosynthesis protein 3 [Smittium culicis]|uniref:Diphthamide biosynthesis protein 3 n=2 Tax=Smittium culicis TaxID=133412 RepID=A0A1R1XLB8_9FUNG|nr:Diphthamide biosynthesis protein 3 [Smittium culicis]OMJ15410.1 Diphthamide biosynthesis protein 3 [Smittium culicis]OMJ26808.1 Diphthamide biosynthesis protein 3 [Smittium culicis]
MSVYDTVEIEDMEFDEDLQLYKYPCPCGDTFQITVEELMDGDDIAKCPSCSLLLRVVYDPEDFNESDQEEISFDSSVLVA